MARNSNTLQRREEIVDAMLVVMARQGYERATIQDIARQAALSPGLIHYHFKNKREILLELLQTIATLSHERFVALSRSAADARAMIRAYIDARLATGPGSNPRAVAAWVVVGAEAVRQAEVRQAYQDIVRKELALLQRLIENMLRERRRPLGEAGQYAATLLAFMEGAFQLSSAARDVMPKGYAATSAAQLIERLVEGA